MYPVREVEIASTIPTDPACYWVPKPSDIDDEGFGCYFRDVWPLIGASTRDAKALIAWERQAADYVANRARDEAEFEELAGGVEAYNPDAGDNDIELPGELADNWTGLGGLELGVAGLAYALSNSRFYPVASCRTHAERTWSDRPVVLFASDRERLRLLAPLADSVGCGIYPDSSRGQPLFAVCSRSIQELMDLAAVLFEQRVAFRKLPKPARRQGIRSRPTAKHPPHPTLF